ncbi:hypothetical protein [Williamsia herbipolensis]|uniref:hypothetical protein n=1 Tax=Williamsia herbipolensis TaxID=1603258 RepID=UPI0005F7B1C0|nr:hypothetical protein [Williamsia herbipolensis]
MDRAIAPTLLGAVGLTALVAIGGADGTLLGRLLGLSLIWTPFGVTLATRGLRDREVASRGNPFQRAGAVLATWYGWVGLTVSAVLVTILVITAPNTWMTHTVCVGVAAVALIMLFVRGRVRQVGAGLLVACSAPGWVFVPIVIVALSVPILVTLLAAAASTLIERRRKRGGLQTSRTDRSRAG